MADHAAEDDRMTAAVTRSFFDHMASHRSARYRLTPQSAEETLQRYLRRLSECVSRDAYDPAGTLQALVFGEWGHGKSQVLYRVDDHLRTHHPQTLTVTIIPAEMDAAGILRAAHAEFRKSDPAAATLLHEAKAAVAALASRERDAVQEVARVLARATKAAGRLHTALLFDEVQTMEAETFVTFLQVLRQRFDEASCCVHTLQCHSLYTDERELKKMAEALGEWLRAGETIHLPSIDIRSAASFYRQRILDVSGSDSLATKLIPEGIAQTLCDVAGGNPRMMLTLAHKVHARTEARGEDHFTGQAVVEVLSATAGPVSGMLLFMHRRLERILQLLPQEWPRGDGEKIATFLRANIARLFADRKRFTASELITALAVDGSWLQKLLGSVGGVPLMTAEDDPDLGATEYRLSDPMREHLSERYGSSGTSAQHKEAQYGLWIRPAKWQRGIALGLTHILQHGGFALSSKPDTVKLGSLPPRGDQVYGYLFDARVEGRSKSQELAVPVLVTSIFDAIPSEEMCAELLRGLRERRWQRIFVFFHHPDFAWEQWRGEGPEAASFNEVAAAQDSPVVGLDSQAWGNIARPTDDDPVHQADVGARSRRFFSDLFAAGEALKARRSVPADLVRHVTDLVRSRHVRLEDICYVPTAEEREMLEHLGRSPNGLLLKELQGVTGRPWKGDQLECLAGQFVQKVGTRWTRVPANRSSLYQRVRDQLKAAKGRHLTIEELAKRVSENSLVPVGIVERLPDAVKWVIRLMKQNGEAEHDDLGFEAWHADLTSENRQRAKELRKVSKQLRKTIDEDLGGFAKELATPLQARLASLDAALETGPDQAGEYRRVLNGLSADLDQLKSAVVEAQERVAADRRTHVESMRRTAARLNALRESVPPDLREYVLPQAGWTQLEGEVGAFERDAAALPQEALRQRATVLRAELEASFRYLNGDEPLGSKQRDRLVQQLLAVPRFMSVRVRWRVEQ